MPAQFSCKRCLLSLILLFILLPGQSCNDECVEPLPTECPSCCIAQPAAIDFDTVTLGTAVDTTFTVTSICTDSLDIDIGETCEELEIETGEGEHRLGPGDRVTVGIRYEPSQTGAFECTVETGHWMVSDVLCTGWCEDPSVCEVTPGELHFGTVTVGDSPEMTFTVKNTGMGYLIGEVYEECDEFSIVSGGGAYRIAAGDSMDVTVRYTPQAEGRHICTISLGHASCGDVICDGTGMYPWRQEFTSSRRLLGVWGSAPDDIFAVGDGGTVLHYNGTDWGGMTSNTTASLTAVWGSSGTDVFAVGFGGTIIYYNGLGWSPMTSGTGNDLLAIWGSSGSDIYAVGEAGTVLYFNGTNWSTIAIGISNWLWGVWGSASNDVYAVGDNGRILNYNGSIWTPMTVGSTRFMSIWGTSGIDIFAGTIDGHIRHYAGSAWDDMTGVPWCENNGIWGASSDFVFSAGNNGRIIHYNGTTWMSVTSGTSWDLFSVWGSSQSDAIAVGGEYAGQGIIVRYGPQP